MYLGALADVRMSDCDLQRASNILPKKAKSRLARTRAGTPPTPSWQLPHRVLRECCLDPSPTCWCPAGNETWNDPDEPTGGFPLRGTMSSFPHSLSTSQGARGIFHVDKGRFNVAFELRPKHLPQLLHIFLEILQASDGEFRP